MNPIKVASLALAASVLVATAAAAQTSYPTEIVRIVTASAQGTTLDVGSRLLAT